MKNTENVYRYKKAKIKVEGTAQYIADYIGVSRNYIYMMLTPAFKKRQSEKENKYPATLEKIGEIRNMNSSLLYMKKFQMFYEGEWQATGSLYELSEETGYTKDYLSKMIEGSKRRENYIKCKKN